MKKMENYVKALLADDPKAFQRVIRGEKIDGDVDSPQFEKILQLYQGKEPLKATLIGSYLRNRNSRIFEYLLGSGLLPDLEMVKLLLRISLDVQLFIDIYQTSEQQEEIEKYLLSQKGDFAIASKFFDPTFFEHNGKIYFGRITEKGKKITPDEILKLERKLNGYQLRTLNEIDRNLYQKMTLRLPKRKFLFNKSQHQQVSYPDVEYLNFELFMRKKWQGNQIRKKTLPFNYEHRDYVNLTEKYHQEFFGAPTFEIVEGTNKEPIEIESGRQEALHKTKDEIRTRLRDRYPHFDEIIKEFKNSKNAYLYVDEAFLLVSLGFSQKGLVRLSKYRLMWNEKILTNQEFTDGKNLPLTSILFDLVDYLQ